MARSRTSSKPRTSATDAPLADEYLLGGEEPTALSIDPDADECPSCFRGRIINNRCGRCGVVIPSSGVEKNYAWGPRRNDNDEEDGG
jgi:hypothetical protein